MSDTAPKTRRPTTAEFERMLGEWAVRTSASVAERFQDALKEQGQKNGVQWAKQEQRIAALEAWRAKQSQPWWRRWLGRN